jgi:hypothetical protein
MSGIPENESVPASPEQPVAPPGAAPVPVLPPENFVRGTLLALLTIPAGIIVFVLIWNLGFVSAIVGFAVAFAASFLYRFGSGGRVSIRGAVVVTAITLGTLVLAFLIAIASDISQIRHESLLESLFGPYLLPAVGASGLSAVLAIVFGLLGCFAVLRSAFQQARTPDVPPPAGPPTTPTPPPAA